MAPGGGSKSKTTDPSSPFYLAGSDSPGLLLTTVMLCGEVNYDNWAKLMKNALKAKNSFVTGSVKKPGEDDAEEWRAWEMCNSMLNGWIHNTIDAKLQPFIKAVWDDLEGSKTRKSCDCGDKCVIAKAIEEEQEHDRVYQFLMGLDESTFGNMRSHILNTSPLPSVNKVYAIVTQEETHRSISRVQDERSQVVGYSAQTDSMKQSDTSMQQRMVPNKPQDRIPCPHCGRTNHDPSKCWNVHGFPPNKSAGRRRGRGGRSAGRYTHAHATFAMDASHPVAANSLPPDVSHSASSQVAAHSVLTPEIVNKLLTLVDQPQSHEKLSGKRIHSQWLIDSGVSRHMTGILALLADITPIPPLSVTLPNGSITYAAKQGSMVFNTNFSLSNVLYVPNLRCNLISVFQLLHSKSSSVTFTDKKCILQDQVLKREIGLGELHEGVYVFQPSCASASAVQAGESIDLWHNRLGHASYDILSLVPEFKDLQNKVVCKACEVCHRAKQTRSMFPISFSRSKECFDLIHCDTWGPYQNSSSSGARYFLTVVDDYSRHVWVFMLADKSETYDRMCKFLAMVLNQFGKTVKIIRSDNGTEFKSNNMVKLLKEKDYTYLRTFGCLSFVNARPKPTDKFSPRSRRCVFIGYAIGQKGWRLFDIEAQQSFVSRDVKIFENIFPFREAPVQSVSAPNSRVPTEPNYFDEGQIVHDGSDASNDSPTPSGSCVPLDDRGSVSLEATPTNEVAARESSLLERSSSSSDASTQQQLLEANLRQTVTRQHRNRKQPSYLQDYACQVAETHTPSSLPTQTNVTSGTRYPMCNYLSLTNFSKQHQDFVVAIDTGHEPRTFQDAMRDSRWVEAMGAEITALEDNHTWCLTDLPPGKRVLPSNYQIAGEDYSETYAPVAKMVSVRTLLAVAVARNWELHQLDVHNAFLNGEISEEVYMRFPPGFSIGSKHKVCRLTKSLYGLRQSPRNWFSKLSSSLTAYGFVQSKAD
ncbi:uncharacterized protein LOC133314306 [Gastrolobium bilobum]|uniref:uncharacterized protein LOC133314306 n=1 Tax=Gastrolobium bilobum TaxID=150636 RepID=UPI002AB2449B|nr:uncharacterized protein LOC133314306 [Gastrolobium bilobum]